MTRIAAYFQMRKPPARVIIFLLLFTYFIMDSCTEEPINETCANPIGSDALTLNIESISCFQQGYKGCFKFKLDGSKVYIQSIYITDTDPLEAPLIFDVGVKECLRDVVEHPAANGKYALYITPGYGYSLKMKDGTFGRLFVDSYKSTGNTVTAVNLFRQYAY